MKRGRHREVVLSDVDHGRHGGAVIADKRGLASPNHGPPAVSTTGCDSILPSETDNPW